MNTLKIASFLAPLGVVAALPTFFAPADASSATLSRKSLVVAPAPAASSSAIHAQLSKLSTIMPSTAAASSTVGGFLPVQIGTDSNISTNPFIQPQDPALAGNGRDQTQQGFDLLFGNPILPSISIGLLGADFMIGSTNIDVLIGGPEHFNPNNRDKVFGLGGDDLFMWSPGDGSDRFEGGAGLDTVALGLIGEQDDQGNIFFRVSNDQVAGNVWLDPITSLPRMDVSGSPGFCNIIDASSSANAAAELAAIDAEHLVQFVIRGIADDFEAGGQNVDNGLRVTLTLKEVEFVVCASRDGGTRQAFDLRVSPPQQISPFALPPAVSLTTF